jgi:hypothetical protein
MAKDTFFFRHDYEPIGDPKIVTLIAKYGGLGYGIYWRIAELLHSEDTHKLAKKKFIYAAIAQQMLTPVEQLVEIVEYMITECELLQADNNFFWSERVFRNIHERLAISEKRSFAGQKSAEKRALLQRNSTDVEQVLTNDEHTSTKKRKEKERKEKERKEEELKFWFLKYYNSSYEIYKKTFTTQSASEGSFKEWKSFIDFIYDNGLEEILECKFISPHSWEKMQKVDKFPKEMWYDVLKKILSTGIKPEHNLFFRIPQFMGYTTAPDVSIQTSVRPEINHTDKSEEEVKKDMVEWSE